MNKSFYKPLFLNTAFDFFSYERYYHDGYYIQPNTLATIPWSANEISIFFKKGLLPTLLELQSNQSHYVFLSPHIPLPESALQPNKFMENIKTCTALGVYHRLCLVYNEPEYVEVFVFGLTKPTRNVFETFINHTNFLEKFCIYARESMGASIIEANEEKMIFDVCKDPKLFKLIDFKNNISYQDFLKDIQLKKYMLKGRNHAKSVSKREFECLFWCAKGKTTKEIGRILSLSPRTVEDYLGNLKGKLGCESKIELVDIALRNPIIKSLID